MVPVLDRSSETLVGLIKRYVSPGTTIYSDCWKAYDRLGCEGYNHLTVNHSLHFKDPDTGVHTNTIEGAWQKAKHGVHMPRFGVKNSHLNGYLATYIWRQKHKNGDLLVDFLDELKAQFGGRCKMANCKHCS